MKTAVFPGSFDPLTKGHEDIALKAIRLFEKLIVAIGENGDKKYMFSIEQRLHWLQTCFEKYPNIECKIYTGLTVDFCKKNNIHYIIRGIRNHTDYEKENEIAAINKLLCPDIETIFLLTDQKYTHFSSTLVKEILRNNGNVKDFIPETISLTQL